MQNDLNNSIQNLLNTLVSEGRERGAQVAVYLDGKRVVDAWAGVADVRSGVPVDGETLFPVFSTTKGMLATVIHILAGRGQVDYEKPIAHYWPEFAAYGKEGVTVRHALSHGSGLPYMPAGITREQLCDWDTMCKLVAQLKPVWPPGERLVYHPVTFGWILGEVARRVDGRAFQPFVEDEICRPLGMTGIYAGLPEELEPRVAFLEEIFELKPAPAEPAPPPNPAEQGVAPCMNPLHECMNDSAARRACIPASNGIMTARAVARHYAALLPGGVDGVELIPPARLAEATRQVMPNGRQEEAATMNIGLGYRIRDGIGPESFGHGGYGGSAGYGDTKHRLAVGVTRNLFSSNDLAGQVAQEIRKSLGLA